MARRFKLSHAAGQRWLVSGLPAKAFKSEEEAAYPATDIELLLEALRYIRGEDVAGLEAHMNPKEVANNALKAFEETGEES